MIKFKPTVIMLIIGIIVFITGISLISIGATTELPVFENKSQERQGNISAYKNDGTMIAVGTSMTVVGLGLIIVGGLYYWRKRE